LARYGSKYTPRKSLEQIFNEYRTRITTDAYGKWPVGYKNHIEHQRIESSAKTANPEYDKNNHSAELRLYNELKEKNSGDRLSAGAPEKKEHNHEAQPEKPIESKPEQDTIETPQEAQPASKEKIEYDSTQGLTDITNKLDGQTDIIAAEKPQENLGLPEYKNEIGQADITRQTDIRVRRRPGFDPLETGW